MESTAENSDLEWDEEEAPSLADLPLTFDQSSPKKFQEKPPWMQVLKSCRASKFSDGHDFEFSSANWTPKSQRNVEFCPADKLFYKGQLLPLTYHHRAGEYSSDYSLPARQDSQSSNSSSGSSSQSSNGGYNANQKLSSCEYLTGGLLSSPETAWYYTATLRSQYSSSPCGKSRVRFPQEDCENPKAVVQEFPSVKRREQRRKGYRILTLIFSCKDASGVVAGAHMMKPKESKGEVPRPMEAVFLKN